MAASSPNYRACTSRSSIDFYILTSLDKRTPHKWILAYKVINRNVGWGTTQKGKDGGMKKDILAASSQWVDRIICTSFSRWCGKGIRELKISLNPLADGGSLGCEIRCGIQGRTTQDQTRNKEMTLGLSLSLPFFLYVCGDGGGTWSLAHARKLPHHWGPPCTKKWF